MRAAQSSGRLGRCGAPYRARASTSQLRMELAPGPDPEADRHVDGLASEVRIAPRRFQIDLDARMCGFEGREVGDQPLRAERLEGAHAERAARASAETPARLLELAQRSLDGREVARSDLRELEARVAPDEELDAQEFLPALDLATQCRGGEMQLHGGSLEARRPRRVHERAQRSGRRQVLGPRRKGYRG